MQRVYLLLFSLAAVLAELDTPFSRENFPAWQKWWFKTPFYVLYVLSSLPACNGMVIDRRVCVLLTLTVSPLSSTAFLNGMGDFTLQLRPTLQLICFMLLSCAAVS